jgi:[CysO sulfur-carrier protein]-S-L-cysteine hydrolase
MIEIAPTLRDQMVEHALREFPNEACGLLAGSFSEDGRANGRPPTASSDRFYPMKNADASPVTYRLDPAEQLAITEAMEGQELELVGIFHSHTHSDAYPSPTDSHQASFIEPFYPDAYYVLVSLQDRNNPVIRAFSIRDGQIEEQDVITA